MVDNYVQGIPELRLEFEKLGKDIQRMTGRRMVAAGAGHTVKVTKKTIKKKGLVKTGALHRNVVKQRDRKPPNGQVRYFIKVRHGNDLKKNKVLRSTIKRRLTGGAAQQKENDPFYWYFLEFGWRTLPRRSDKNPGSVRQRRKVSRGRTRVHPKRPLRDGFVLSRPGIEPEMIKAYQKDMAKRRNTHGKQMIKWGYQ